MSTLAWTTAKAVNAALVEAVARDESVLLLGDSLRRDGGHYRLAGIRALGDDHALDTPASDRAAAGFALGLALGGRRPVLELPHAAALIAVLPTVQRAAQIAATGFACPLVLRVPIGGEAGPVLDASVGALLPALAGARVCVAKDAASARRQLQHALQSSGPTVLLEPRALADTSAAFDGDHVGAALLTDDTPAHVTLAAYGAGVATALQAREQLREQGITAAVLDLAVLAPLDNELIGRCLRASGRLVVVSDDASLVAFVHQAAVQAAFLYLESPLGAAAPDPEAVVRAARQAVHW